MVLAFGVGMPSPSLEELVALSPAAVRSALLARGLGLSEPEVAAALDMLKERAVAKAKMRSKRLAVDDESSGLRAGSDGAATATGSAGADERPARPAAPSGSAVDYAADRLKAWFLGT
jgi:hypothetical protein